MKGLYSLFAVAACCAAVCPIEARATTYLYTYTGNPFTNTNPPFTTSDFIKFQFVSTGTLGANWSDTPFSSPISSWSLSLGPLHYDNADGVLYSINFSTDAASHITGYQFTTQTDVVAPGLLPWSYGPQPYVEEVFSFDLPPTFGVEDAVYIPRIAMDSDYASNSNTPGTWTITPIPEATTWALMLIGFAGLGAAGVRTRLPKTRA